MVTFSRAGRATFSLAVSARSAAVLASLLLAPLLPAAAGAQELEIKRDLPAAPGPCELARGAGEGALPSASPREDPSTRPVAELVAEASQASILGDRERARALLREAVRAEPEDPALRYRLGRLLEASGREEEAAAEYCAYLALAPDGTEAGEVRDRLGEIEALTWPLDQARAAFREGVRAYDSGDYEMAAIHFTDALEAFPEWEEARFNRGLAYRRSGQPAAGAADLERYLELRPDAPERSRIEAEARQARARPGPRLGPSTVLVTGILMPGMGHIYSGDVETGVVVLGAAAASAAAALLYRRIEIECLSLPVDGRCPEGHERDRRESRPLLAPGLGIAAVITIGGAIHAYLNARDGSGAVGAGPLAAGGDRVSLLLEPGRPGAPSRAGVRITF